MARKGPYVANRKAAQWGGYACVLTGAWLLYDAYDRRGRRKPFAAKFLPGA